MVRRIAPAAQHAVMEAERLFAGFSSVIGDAAGNLITNMADCVAACDGNAPAQARCVKLLSVAAQIRQLAEYTVSDEGQAAYAADVKAAFEAE
jgi:hypothetical protein